MALLVKNPSAKKRKIKKRIHLQCGRETWVRFLGWEDPLEKGKATHSSILAWRIPDCIVRPWGGKESDTTEGLSLFYFHFLWWSSG